MSKEPKPRLERVIASLGTPKIMVIGDLILDHYIRGGVDRISPEAPIPILRAEVEEYRIGGAGNVANNIASLAGEATLIGIVGDDWVARRMREELELHGLSSDGLIVDSSRRTTLKSRMMALSQQLLRVDHEDSGPIARPVEDRVLAVVKERLPDTDIILISDYAKGLLTNRVLSEVIQLCRAAGKKVIVDPKGHKYDKYRGATALTPNLSEARAATGETLRNDAERQLAGEAMIRSLQLDALLITLSADGMVLIRPDRHAFRVRSKPIQVYDVTGAGDTAIAVLGLVLGAGRSWEAAVSLANRAGGLVVRRLGTATVTRAELADAVREDDRSISGRLTSPSTLNEIRSHDDNPSSTLAVVTGSFEQVNERAIAIIQKASESADRTLVLIPETCPNRSVLEDLRSVDHVMLSKNLLADLRQLEPAMIAFESPLFEVEAFARETGIRRLEL